MDLLQNAETYRTAWRRTRANIAKKRKGRFLIDEKDRNNGLRQKIKAKISKKSKSKAF